MFDEEIIKPDPDSLFEITYRWNDIHSSNGSEMTLVRNSN